MPPLSESPYLLAEVITAARAEIQRLGETVKEQAIELTLLRGKSRWG